MLKMLICWLFVNGLQQLQRRLYLSLRLAGFHCGADDGNVFPLGRNIVSIGDHADVDVWRIESRVEQRSDQSYINSVFTDGWTLGSSGNGQHYHSLGVVFLWQHSYSPFSSVLVPTTIMREISGSYCSSMLTRPGRKQVFRAFALKKLWVRKPKQGTERW